MAHTTTWEPWDGDAEGRLPQHVFAFPARRAEPLIDAPGVRSAIERIHLIPEVSDEERCQAFDNIKKAARHFNVEICGDTYEEMGARPQVEIIPRD